MCSRIYETGDLKMEEADEAVCDNILHAFSEEQNRAVFIQKINQIVSTMSLRNLEKILDVIEVIRE